MSRGADTCPPRHGPHCPPDFRLCGRAIRQRLHLGRIEHLPPVARSYPHLLARASAPRHRPHDLLHREPTHRRRHHHSQQSVEGDDRALQHLPPRDVALRVARLVAAPRPQRPHLLDGHRPRISSLHVVHGTTPPVTDQAHPPPFHVVAPVTGTTTTPPHRATRDSFASGNASLHSHSSRVVPSLARMRPSASSAAFRSPSTVARFASTHTFRASALRSGLISPTDPSSCTRPSSTSSHRTSSCPRTPPARTSCAPPPTAPSCSTPCCTTSRSSSLASHTHRARTSRTSRPALSLGISGTSSSATPPSPRPDSRGRMPSAPTPPEPPPPPRSGGRTASHGTSARPYRLDSRLPSDYPLLQRCSPTARPRSGRRLSRGS